MSETLIAAAGETSIPIRLLTAPEAPAFLEASTPGVRGHAGIQEFKAKAGQVLLIPSGEGAVDHVLAGIGEGDAMSLRALPGKLPAGDYHFEGLPAAVDPAQAAITWGLGGYRFDRYRPARGARPRLVVADGVDLQSVLAVVHACSLARDMINTPANDMGPRQMETIAREIAEAHGAQCSVVVGDALLEAGYPAVHAVGRSATLERAPRMIEISWSAPGEGLPLVVLVGKGVVFDTGGLDIKPSSGMRLMKKDMGGAAHALALGRMIMAAGLPVRLAVLLPVVENAISAESMRPGDVLATRKGLTVEVGNTDAEGRLILADALARADELTPDLTIDLATLTGAARAALGPQLPPFFTTDDALASAVETASREVCDPLWRMPLWEGYADAIEGDIADLKNDPDAWAQAGAVTAALFLQRFAPQGAWIHLDIFAWNARARPGWPAGGEAQAVRALFRMVETRFG